MIYFKNMADRSQLQKFLRAQSELCWRCFQELKKQILEDLKPELQASIWVEVEPVIFLVVFSWPPSAIIFMAMPPVMVGLWQAFPGFFLDRGVSNVPMMIQAMSNSKVS